MPPSQPPVHIDQPAQCARPAGRCVDRTASRRIIRGFAVRELLSARPSVVVACYNHVGRATFVGTAYTMSDGRIRIRMEAYDHQALDASAREIVDHAKRTGARVAGPIPLPTRREIYTVNRSPFIDKKSREQFEIRTHKRIIDITEPNARTVEALNRLVVPAGVFVKIKA